MLVVVFMQISRRRAATRQASQNTSQCGIEAATCSIYTDTIYDEIFARNITADLLFAEFGCLSGAVFERQRKVPDGQSVAT
jgi:hypothetical protein